MQPIVSNTQEKCSLLTRGFAKGINSHLLIFENYKKITEQDKRPDTNTESNGRFHTDWLNMILILDKNFLIKII